MRHRRRKRMRLRLDRIAALLVLALLIPVSVTWLAGNLARLEQTGEKAAMLAAALTMPEEGLDYLKDRFQEELYPGDDLHHQPGTDWLEDLPVPQPDSESGSASNAGEDRPVEENSASSESAESSQGGTTAPRIPMQYRAEIISEDFGGAGKNGLLKYESGYIKSESKLSADEVMEILETPFDLGFVETSEPQVLIVHTHATEAFERYDTKYYDTRNTWRSRDNNMNMVSVGAAMAQVLEDNGIGVIHDTTQHDYPSYNGSYERSAATIKQYLEEYPTIKVVLDLHRDAMERDNEAIVKPVKEINGQKVAQIMIIASADDTGTVGVPEYRKNLRFAAAFQSYMESQYPGLTRPLYFAYRKYNQNLTPGSLLLEFGSNANTLEEAVYAAQLCGQALADLIHDHME